jgi:capsular polysaccharide transport system permease protein
MTRSTVAPLLIGRVVTAILLREMRTRFGSNRLGYLWALAEPFLHLSMFIILFELLGRAAPVGTDIALFLATGVFPWLLFDHVADRTMKAIEANRALLTYPQVTPVDLVLARVLLETVTLLLVFILFGVGCFLMRGPFAIDSPLAVLAAFLCLSVLGTGVGLIAAAITVVIPTFAPSFAMAKRLFYFVSGVFFIAERLPPAARDWLQFNPILHCIEWLRSAFFVGFESHFASPSFAVAVASAAFLIGLAAERAVRPMVKLA